MAGDLMFAHAEYHSTYPLPICGYAGKIVKVTA